VIKRMVKAFLGCLLAGYLEVDKLPSITLYQGDLLVVMFTERLPADASHQIQARLQELIGCEIKVVVIDRQVEFIPVHKVTGHFPEQDYEVR
jgi:hypothetical protein